MSKIEIEYTDDSLVGNAGIVAVGELLRIADFIFANTIDANESQNQISTEDILKVAIALLCVGKCGFEYIKEFDNEFIMKALKVARIASPATFRQRLEKICEDPKLLEELRLSMIRLIKVCDKKNLLSSIGGRTWIRVDTDTSVFDNSDTKKEGISYGYNKVEGFAPRFSFLPGRIIIGSELLPGNFHATHEGYIDYIS